MKHQRGLTLLSLIFFGVLLAAGAFVVMKVVPYISEFSSIRKAVQMSKDTGNSVREIRSAFGRQRDIDNIQSLTPEDLVITKTANGYEISFAYAAKIELIAPVSLVIDFRGDTRQTGGREVAI